MDWSWIKEITIDELALIVKERRPFAFARYGDGEWMSLLQARPAHKSNCDGHQYFVDMGEAIAQTLIDKPTYCLGMQNLAIRVYPGRINFFLEQNKLRDLNWVYADVLHRSSIAGTLHTLAKECFGAVWVGPAHLRALATRMKCKTFIECRLPNSWSDYESLQNQLYDATEMNSLVLLSCGMPAKVLINKLQKQRPTATILDIGAAWDPYAGVRSRKYMKEGEYSVESLLRGCDG